MDFNSFGKPFHICGPTDSILFEPKLLDLVLYRVSQKKRGVFGGL